MNTDIQNTPLNPQNLAPINVLKRKRRPHGKIAELPKALRDQINQMLDDGFSYRKIAEKLKASGSDLPQGVISRMSVLRWHDNGYQRYLDQQQRLAEVRANREAALDMVAAGDTTALPEADLQLIASQYYDLFAQNQAQLIKQIAIVARISSSPSRMGNETHRPTPMSSINHSSNVVRCPKEPCVGDHFPQ